jgi:hypothetical protein
MSLFLPFFLIYLVFVRDTALVKTKSLDTGTFALVHTFRSFTGAPASVPATNFLKFEFSKSLAEIDTKHSFLSVCWVGGMGGGIESHSK